MADELNPVEQTEELEQAEQTPQSRREARVQKLANERAEALAEAKLAKEQAEFYRRQAEQLAQQRQQTPPADDVYLDPDEKWRRESQAMLQRGLAQSQDMADKAEFALASVKSTLKAKYADRVEAELQKARSAGFNPTREQVYLVLLGRDVDANHGKPTPAAQAAKKRVDAAKTTTPGARSNVAAPRGDKSLEERLSGMIL